MSIDDLRNKVQQALKLRPFYTPSPPPIFDRPYKMVSAESVMKDIMKSIGKRMGLDYWTEDYSTSGFTDENAREIVTIHRKLILGQKSWSQKKYVYSTEIIVKRDGRRWNEKIDINDEHKLEKLKRGIEEEIIRILGIE